MERRRWAHGHISAFTSCAMVGRSLFFLTLESYFAFCGEKVGYQCFLQSKILSLISNYNIFSIEFRAGPEMNKILKSTFFHATFCIMEIRHCPWKAVTVLTIRRNQRELCCEIVENTQTDLQTSHWNSLTQIHLTGSTGLQIKYQLQSYDDGTIPWPLPVLMFCVTLLTLSQYASKITSTCVKVVQLAMWKWQ